MRRSLRFTLPSSHARSVVRHVLARQAPMAVRSLLLPLVAMTLLTSGCEAQATSVFKAPTPSPESAVAGVSVSAPRGSLGPAGSPGAGGVNTWDPRIGIVFPVYPPGASGDINKSTGINVSLWPTNAVLCNGLPGPSIGLYVAKNNEPGDLLQPTKLQLRTQGKTRFPTLEFNDVRTSLAADPNAKYSLVAMANGQPVSNVWVHGGTSPAKYEDVPPTGYGSTDPAAVDTRIQVVFPHDDQGKQVAAAAATRVNIAVDIFEHGTTLSVPPSAPYTPRLWFAEGNGQLQLTLPGVQKTTYTLKGQGYPRWVFNNVPVQPGANTHFVATLDSVQTYPSIWTHGDAHPAIPAPKTPPACIP
jgi:hypothetical protein